VSAPGSVSFKNNHISGDAADATPLASILHT
jgi:hypothetical protein